MSNLDQITGKLKEAAGDVLGDGKLKAEGLIQQGVGKAKEVVSEAEKQTAEVMEKGKHSAKKPFMKPRAKPKA